MNQPQEFEEERVEIQRMIDRVCDMLESMWDAGKEPDIAEHVNAFDDDSVPGLLSEIMKSDREINQLNQSQLREKYVQTFPQHEKTINAILKSMFAEVSKADESEHETTHGGSGPTMNRDRDFVGEKIGDYLVVKKIGAGTFGIVYLARDMILGRDIVIKIPRRNANFRQEDVDFFLDEARNSCFLHHEYILRVLHVGMHQGLPYIVQDYFEGGDLRKALENNSYSIKATIDFIRKVSEAIGYAHQFRIIHRDLKPANILIKQNGDPVVADFGLAIRDPHLSGKPGEVAGTIQYMSPEQVRGESHRLDGRSDVWSIGVILYLMLVGRLPFEGDGIEQIRDAILFGRPTPPRQLNGDISKELNRICLKCLASRVADRYLTALDLADDLRELESEAAKTVAVNSVATREPSDRQVAVVPKGLMAFDKNDSEFFLELLPGPLDREGIPECIHFWKNRIEDPMLSRPVGLIYGPSGCGKSSLVSAGLLPRLADDILVIHIESTPNDTEVRLFKALRAAIPSIPENPSLPDVIAGIRTGDYLPRDKRLLIVFDQFEQWLHANTIDEHSQLIDAIRQCDGRSVQALVLVRDDFWMGVSRFFRQLEIELVERQNFASVDLFSKRHAKDVLIKFGQAFGTLPQNETKISESQHQFLTKAIDMIAENDSVICVRCVLFAETVKNRPWELDTLRKIGDSKNIGIVFLEQVLGEGATNPKYRYHRKSLLAVLESLLPDEGVEIKGNLRSRNELAQAAQLDPVGQDFETVLQILDGELRLVTPTEPDTGRVSLTNEFEESKNRSEASTVKITSWFQLTHDYLVPSLRAWMQNVRGRTRRGRAKLRLQSLATQWQSSGQARFLPSFLEYCSIIWNVPANNRDQLESRLMQKANGYFGFRLAIFLLIAFSALAVWWRNLENTRRNETATRVAQFLTAKPDEIPLVLDEFLRPNKAVAVNLLNEFMDRKIGNEKKARCYVGLAMLNNLAKKDVEQGVLHLIDYATYCQEKECVNLVAALSQIQSDHEVDVDQFIETATRTTQNDDHWARFQIIRMFMQPNSLPQSAFEFCDDPTRRTNLIETLQQWQGDPWEFLTMIKNAKDESALTGLCIALGRLKPSDLQFERSDGSNLFVELQAQIKLLFEGDQNLSIEPDPRASIHSSARWALTNWNVTVNNPTLPPAKSAWWKKTNWWINELGMTMVRVKAGSVDGEAETKTKTLVESEFSISTCEVTSGNFSQFLKEADAAFKQKWSNQSRSDLPKSAAMNEITVHEAILFCNWLSEKEDRQPCYEEVKEGDPLEIDGTEIVRWKIVEGANGYRLPWGNEWELAARGGPEKGCTTPYYFVSRPDESNYLEYLWCWMNSSVNGSRLPQNVATRIPNQIGLFDVLGNLNEFSSDSGEILDKRGAIQTRGGAFELGLQDCTLQLLPGSWLLGNRRSPYCGFRIATAYFPDANEKRVPNN